MEDQKQKLSTTDKEEKSRPKLYVPRSPLSMPSPSSTAGLPLVPMSPITPKLTDVPSFNPTTVQRLSHRQSVSGGSAEDYPSVPAPYSLAFLKKIPKTDLHVHLDGCVRLDTLIDLARQQNVELPSYTIEGLKETIFKENYASLEEYLKCFGTLCSVLRTGDALTRVSYELAWDCFHEGIRYFEVRFAPQLHIDISQSDSLPDIVSVLRYVNEGLRQAKKEINELEAIKRGEEPRFEYGIIVCALRMFNEHFSSYYCSFCAVHKHEEPERIFSLASMALITAAAIARDDEGIPVVGLDIAGAEKGYPAEAHKAAFAYAHKKHFGKTVHAGEGYGPESIFQAITDLYAERIGHGFHLFSSDKVNVNKIHDKRGPDHYVDSLVQYVADRRITFEVCLSSNLQTMPELGGSFKNHAFGKMLESRISVTLGTDNRTVSHTNIVKEYCLAVSHFTVTPKQLKDLVVAGFKRCFFPQVYKEKRAYVRQVIDYYEKLEAEFGIVTVAPTPIHRPLITAPVPDGKASEPH